MLRIIMPLDDILYLTNWSILCSHSLLNYYVVRTFQTQEKLMKKAEEKEKNDFIRHVTLKKRTIDG